VANSKNKILALLLVVLLFPGTIFSQNLTPQPAASGNWIRSWLLCGPIFLREQADASNAWDHQEGFSADYLLKYGGEKTLSVKAGDMVKHPQGTAKWILFNSTDSVIDLDKEVSTKSPVLAYAYTEIQSDEDKIWLMGLGTNDGGKLWLNGVEVWDYPEPRGLVPDDDMIPVALKKGKNTILLKIEDRGNRWGFCLRLLPFTTSKLEESGGLFRISSNERGEAFIISGYREDVLRQLIQSLNIVITDNRNKPLISEQSTNMFCRKLDLGSDQYRPYKARLVTRLRNGVVINSESVFFAGKKIDYNLFSNGISDYSIVISSQPSESERWAADELQHWLREISGAKLPVVDFGQPSKGPRIAIGYNEIVKKITGEEPPSDLDESFRYFNEGPDIYIYGGKLRGSMYGVMAFLENELGCRWYTPAVSVIPERKELSFSWFDHSEKPGVRVRNDFYFEAFDPVWAARNRVNGAMGYRERHGGVESYWAVHTFYPLMPPAEYFDKHPEYYSLIEGKRTSDRAQLCLSNPDVLKIITEKIKERMHQSPEYLIYDVSQNDWYNPCQCEKCQEIVKRYGGESGLIVWFVNQVAESVEKEFPDKFIGTLAYQYTRTPPKDIRPRNNVVIRLCSIECCFAHDFKSCPENRSFLADLEKWSALAPHLYIWDYVVNFSHYIMPYPNFNVLQSNIQTFRDNNSIGIMEQAAYQGKGGEFAELRAYLLSKLLWNPECDAQKVINDFMYGYYGRSGKFIREYFDLLHGRVTPETHFGLGLTPWDPIFSDDFVNQSVNIFEEAAKVADNEDILHRVEMASLPVLYLKCKRSPVLSKYDGTYAKFCEIVKREGVTMYAEAGEPHRVSFHRGVENAK
jgi:hypothetical protein